MHDEFCKGQLGRRGLLIGAAGLWAARPARAATPVRLQLSWLKNVEFGGAYLAASNGAFAKRGLDVTLLAGGPQIDPMALVASGAVDIALSSSALPVLVARMHGVPVEVVGAVLQRSPLGLAARADKAIELPSGLAGARIGYQLVNRSLLLAILAANHVREDQVTSSVVTADPMPLIEGRIDLMTASVLNVPLAMEAAGVKARSWLAYDLGLPMQGDVVVCLANTLKRQPEMVSGMLAGLAEGYRQQDADPAGVARKVVDDGFGEGLQLGHQTEYARRMVPLVEAGPLLGIDRAAWEATDRAALHTGLIDPLIDLDVLLHPVAVTG